MVMSLERGCPQGPCVTHPMSSGGSAASDGLGANSDMTAESLLVCSEEAT